VVRFDEITLSHRYPTRINGHYVIDPSPIPRWDVPRLHQSPALVLLGAGREKKIYAVPPYTVAEPLVFDDIAFRVEDFRNANGQRIACRCCGSTVSFLDELIDDAGKVTHQCSDSAYCEEEQEKIVARKQA